MQTRNNLYFNDHATINALGIATTFPADRLLSMHTTGANAITVCFLDMDNDGDDNDHVALTLTNEFCVRPEDVILFIFTNLLLYLIKLIY